jgi:hypothetical protein
MLGVRERIVNHYFSTLYDYADGKNMRLLKKSTPKKLDPVF